MPRISDSFQSNELDRLAMTYKGRYGRKLQGNPDYYSNHIFLFKSRDTAARFIKLVNRRWKSSSRRKATSPVVPPGFYGRVAGHDKAVSVPQAFIPRMIRSLNGR